jgi:hypothetical protein
MLRLSAYRRNTMNKHDGEPNLIKRCGRIGSCFASEAAQSDLRLSMKPILRATMVEHGPVSRDHDLRVVASRRRAATASR